MCEDPLAADIEPQPETDPIWITADGRVLLMSEMTLDHLNNTINYLNVRIQDLEGLRGQLANARAEKFRECYDI